MTGPNAAAGCLDETQILLLLEGNLPEDGRADVEAHLDECEACRRLVGAAAPTDAGLDADQHLLVRGTSIGRYLVLSLLGRGGMGRVYAAYDPELDRRVALKLLHTTGGSEGARRRLAREARALGKLSHPNVVQVHDVGEHRGDVFVAMELVEGQSLDAWCRGTPKPAWQEVLTAYLDAARGLAAAHEKGLVHRDVKPANILRGNDGRVRVADFGLAAGQEGATRSASDPAPRAASDVLGDEASASETTPASMCPAAAPDERLTATGALLGTPLFMAPEQHEGLRATEASDQYSLCAALHHGLYGKLPFTFESDTAPLDQLLSAKKEGAPAASPAGTPVPAWVYRALARGLAPDPFERYPSLDALIAALREDPDGRRRSRLRTAGLGVTAAALLAVAAAVWTKSAAMRDPCAHPEQQLAGAWDEDVKGRVRAAFLTTGRAHIEGTVTRVLARLDAYGTEWATMRSDVCSASRREPQRREVLDLRDACLDRRRDQLLALTTLFAEKSDSDVVDKSVQMAAGLYPVASCADLEALTARVRPPEDPALRARVTALQPRADRLDPLYKAGKYKDGLALGEPLLVETAALPYPPLRAQVQFWVGRLRDGAGDQEGGKALLRDAAVSAAEGRDDILAANAWTALLVLVGDHQKRFEEAAVLRTLGPMVMVRVQDERTQASWSTAQGIVLWRAGKLAEAIVAHERALALREKALGPDHPDTISSLNNLGIVLFAQGDCSPAKAMLERAVVVSERTLGPEHPDTAASLSNLGNACRRTGDYARALVVHERALAIKEKALGPDHPSVGSSLNNLGNVLYDLGDYHRASATFARALAIKEKALGPDHPDVANSLVGVGQVMVRLNQLDTALPVLERARVLREKKGLSDPDVAGPLLGLGELYVARGTPSEAVAPLERGLALDNAEYASELELTLAEALWRLGRDHSRARALAEQAQAAYERLGHRPGLDRATHWLVEHPG